MTASSWTSRKVPPILPETALSRSLLVSPYASVLQQEVYRHLREGDRVLVPSMQAGLVVRSFVPGVRTETLTQQARRLLQRAGWRMLRVSEPEDTVRSVLQNLPWDYLGPVMERPGTVTVLLTLLGELLRAHVDPEALLEVAKVGREQDVARVYAAYHAHCLQEKVFDAAGAEHFAVLTAKVRPSRTVVHGFSYLDAAQVALVNRLLGEGSLVTLPLPKAAGASRTRETAERLQAQGFAMQFLETAPVTVGDRAIRGYLGGRLCPEVTRLEAPQVETEVRHGLRTVVAALESGVRAEEIGIVVRSEARYLPVLTDVAREYGVPLISGQLRPLGHTALGGLLQVFIAAQRSEWRYRQTQALLTHPLLSWPADLLEQAHRLRQAAPQGLQAWSPELTWLALPAEFPWSAGVQVLQRMLIEGGVWERCRHEPALNVALRTLVRHLAGVSRRTERCGRAAFLGRLGHVLEGVTLPTLLGKSAVRVVNPLGALGRRFRMVWILGLSDGIFPVHRGDHPLVDALTRRQWAAQDVHVPDITQLASVEEALFLACLATAGESLLLSRSERDLQGRRLPPSPFWQRIQGGMALPELPFGHLRERETALAASGQLPRRWHKAQAVEEAHTLGPPGPHTSFLAGAVEGWGQA